MLKHGFRTFEGRFKVAQFQAANCPGGPDFNLQQPMMYRKRNLKHHSRRIGFG